MATIIKCLCAGVVGGVLLGMAQETPKPNEYMAKPCLEIQNDRVLLAAAFRATKYLDLRERVAVQGGLIPGIEKSEKAYKAKKCGRELLFSRFGKK